MDTSFLTEETLLYLICLGVGVGVLVSLSALRNVLSRRETATEVTSRRMRMIQDGRSIEERLALLRPTARAGSLAWLPLFGGLPLKLRRARVSMAPARFAGLCLVATVLVFAVLALRFPVWMAIAAALVAGIGLPLAALRIRISAQRKTLIAQLPDALDLLARGLRVGHPLNASIGAVAQQMPDPVGSEFGLVFDQVNYGENLPDAFQDFAERVDIEDVHYLSSSIGIQHGTGSDLARMIDVLSKVIRNRIMLRRKVHAISAEGRLTAVFLSVVPVMMFGFTTLTAPEYFGGVMDDPLFIPMAVTVVFLTVLNAVVMNRLVNFHV